MYDIMHRMGLIMSNIGPNTIVDIGIVYYVLYRGYILIRDMRAKQLVKGIVLLVALIPISQIFELYMVDVYKRQALVAAAFAPLISIREE